EVLDTRCVLLRPDDLLTGLDVETDDAHVSWACFEGIPVERKCFVRSACLLVDVFGVEHSLATNEVAQAAELLVGGELDERPSCPPNIARQVVHRVRCASADAGDPIEVDPSLEKCDNHGAGE